MRNYSNDVQGRPHGRSFADTTKTVAFFNTKSGVGKTSRERQLPWPLEAGNAAKRPGSDPFFSSIFPRQQDCRGGAIRLGDQPYRQRPRYDVAG